MENFETFRGLDQTVEEGGDNDSNIDIFTSVHTPLSNLQPADNKNRFCTKLMVNILSSKPSYESYKMEPKHKPRNPEVEARKSLHEKKGSQAARNQRPTETRDSASRQPN